MQHYVTPDLCDAYPDLVQVLEPMFSNFGGRDSFGGQIVTIKCFEDNSLVKAAVDSPGQGRVLVDDDDALGGLGDDVVLVQLRAGGAQGMLLVRLRLLLAGGRRAS